MEDALDDLSSADSGDWRPARDVALDDLVGELEPCNADAEMALDYLSDVDCESTRPEQPASFEHVEGAPVSHDGLGELVLANVSPMQARIDALGSETRIAVPEQIANAHAILQCGWFNKVVPPSPLAEQYSSDVAVLLSSEDVALRTKK